MYVSPPTERPSNHVRSNAMAPILDCAMASVTWGVSKPPEAQTLPPEILVELFWGSTRSQGLRNLPC